MSNSRQLPEGIYESLPYLYMAAGLLAAFSLGNLFGMLSGLALISAGVMVWSTRRAYRRAARQRVLLPARGGVALACGRDTDLVQIAWSPEYECGNATIDAQHRRLFELGDALLNAILEQQSKLDVELLLDELVRDVAKHFSSEEAILAEVNHPLTPEHKAVHRHLLARCQDMAERFHKDELKVGELFRFVAIDVVAGHILEEDIKYFSSTK